MATPRPFPSDFAFSAISVFASSISSRTSSDAFVETSLTTSPSDLSAVSPLPVKLLLIVAAANHLEDLRHDEAGDERTDHRDLGVSAARGGSLVCVPGGLRLAVVGCACFH